MTDPIVVLDEVSYVYQGADEAAIENISLRVMPGEYVAILGLNGAGKTTLGLTLNGVVPTMLGGELQGSVHVAGLNVADYAVREMAKVVGIVFDNPEFQMSQQTVAEEVALGLENAGVPFEDMKVAIDRALGMVGLSGFEDRSPLRLSGGQQQRLAIASVLAMRPQVLIMDEPTSNLDPIGKSEVFAMAGHLNRDEGMTIIVMEHEVEVMGEFADRIIVMDHGRIVMNGSPREVLTRVDELEALGLRAPASAELASLLEKDHGAWTGPLPITTEEAVESVNRALGVTT